MGGFVGGMIAGAVVVLVLGAALSLNTPLAGRPEVSTQAPELAGVAPAADPVVADAVPDADLLDITPDAPKSADDKTDDLSDIADAETAPDAQPDLSDEAPSLELPQPALPAEVAVAPTAPAALPGPDSVPVAPGPEAAPGVFDETPEPPAARDEVEIALPEPVPELPGTAPQDEQDNPFENSPIAVEGDEDTLPRELPRIAALPQVGDEGENSGSTIIGKRVVPLTERDDPPAEPTAEAEQPVGKPIEAYAANFENPEAKPLMSIILIDDEGAFGAEALQDFPYPVSFAINPSDPEAAEKMARHRAAGFEVLALADLPEAASAQDAEVSMSVWLDMLPETVGILEGVETGIQGNRKLADQVAAIAGDTGRGLITQDNGLNTVQKLAARNGVPSGVIFRDIDGARQDPTVMRRFLDQAAFRAGQEGTVVMLGRVRPETISALVLWGLEDRDNRVAMAPISAVMMREVQ